MLPSKLVFFKIQITCNTRLPVIRSHLKLEYQLICIHVFHNTQSFLDYNPPSKMIQLIIPAAVRKGFRRCTTRRILTWYSLLAGATSLSLQTWWRWCCRMLESPAKTSPYRSIRKHYYKLTVVNLVKVRCSCGSVVEHCVSSAKVVGSIPENNTYW